MACADQGILRSRFEQVTAERAETIFQSADSAPLDDSLFKLPSPKRALRAVCRLLFTNFGARLGGLMHRNKSDCHKLPQAARAEDMRPKRHSVRRSVALHLIVCTVALVDSGQNAARQRRVSRSPANSHNSDLALCLTR